MNWTDLAKYFVHGIAFSFLFLVLAFVLVFILVFLVAVGSFIGLIIGFGILMLTVGGLNCFLTWVIWGVEIKTSFWSVLLHGFALFLVLLLVNGILVMIPNVAFPSIATTVITFIIGAFAGGFVGKKVAELFEEEFQKEEISEAENAYTHTRQDYPEHVRCPKCGEDVSLGGLKYKWCPHCRAKLEET
ncbi:MAG: hypothetical protein JSV12_05565 [Candidatus Bathyarchaeota archaeon]|nr:MAG: hypothetical protein JSV12_05565 [Candidatus Bathyarchaeota archaeon]